MTEGNVPKVLYNTLRKNCELFGSKPTWIITISLYLITHSHNTAMKGNYITKFYNSTLLDGIGNGNIFLKKQ